jgi:hypothetical protein
MRNVYELDFIQEDPRLSGDLYLPGRVEEVLKILELINYKSVDILAQTQLLIRGLITPVFVGVITLGDLVDPVDDLLLYSFNSENSVMVIDKATIETSEKTNIVSSNSKAMDKIFHISFWLAKLISENSVVFNNINKQLNKKNPLIKDETSILYRMKIFDRNGTEVSLNESIMNITNGLTGNLGPNERTHILLITIYKSMLNFTPELTFIYSKNGSQRGITLWDSLTKRNYCMFFDNFNSVEDFWLYTNVEDFPMFFNMYCIIASFMYPTTTLKKVEVIKKLVQSRENRLRGRIGSTTLFNNTLGLSLDQAKNSLRTSNIIDIEVTSEGLVIKCVVIIDNNNNNRRDENKTFLFKLGEVSSGSIRLNFENKQQPWIIHPWHYDEKYTDGRIKIDSLSVVVDSKMISNSEIKSIKLFKGLEPTMYTMEEILSNQGARYDLSRLNKIFRECNIFEFLDDQDRNLFSNPSIIAEFEKITGMTLPSMFNLISNVYLEEIKKKAESKLYQSIVIDKGDIFKGLEGSNEDGYNLEKIVIVLNWLISTSYVGVTNNKEKGANRISSAAYKLVFLSFKYKIISVNKYNIIVENILNNFDKKDIFSNYIIGNEKRNLQVNAITANKQPISIAILMLRMMKEDNCVLLLEHASTRIKNKFQISYRLYVLIILNANNKNIVSTMLEYLI